MRLYRAADDDYISDTASFAETREAAEVYRANPGYGGSTLWMVDVEPQHVLDLVDERDPVRTVARLIGAPHPNAIGADEYVPRVSDRIAAAGYEWVRVRESYPADTITWIWIGGDEPEMVECE